MDTKQVARPGGVLNRNGRPQGSKNKISLLKMVAEEAVLERNYDKMQAVCNTIIHQALKGCKSSQKLVWQSMMSNGLLESKNATERVEITINTTQPKEAQRAVIIDQKESTNE